MNTDQTATTSWLPEGHTFACFLSHDIDRLRKYQDRPRRAFRLAAQDVLRRGDVKCCLRRLREIRSLAFGRDPAKSFRFLLDAERKRGLSASYFFMTTGPQPEEAGYAVEEAREWIEMIEEAGMEVGLHAGLATYLDHASMAEQKERLDSVVACHRYGVRQHRLRLAIPETWHIQADLGFLYDASYGYNEKPGPPANAYLPFRPVDPLTRKEIGIWELPLTIMDGTLRGYLKLSPAEGLELAKRKVDEAYERRGLLSLLWHNTSLDDTDWHGWRYVYEILLDYLLERGGWIASGREIIDRWVQALGGG